MKSKVIAILWLGFWACMGFQAKAEVDLVRIRREMSILMSALEAALSFDETRVGETDGFQSTRDLLPTIQVKGTYLMSQGVLLTIERRSSALADLAQLETWHFASPDFGALPPMPDVPDWDSDDYEDELEEYQDALEEIQEALSDAEKILRQHMEHYAEYYRLRQPEELQKQLRELGRSHRDQVEQYRQELKAIRKQIADTEAMDDEDRERLLVEIRQHRDSLERTRSGYAQRIQELEQREWEAWKQDKSRLERDLIDSLCSYGATLTALPDNQHLSVIVKGVGQGPDAMEADLVYVFRKQDLLDCREGRLTWKDLLERSASYAL